uniref:(northern house mosquito) hypothetical protein n=1 Tax=Culex pipiens TaxID=7175 RepID=A0A8D7ZX26_CULPI
METTITTVAPAAATGLEVMAMEPAMVAAPGGVMEIIHPAVSQRCPPGLVRSAPPPRPVPSSTKAFTCSTGPSTCAIRAASRRRPSASSRPSCRLRTSSRSA